MAEVLLLQLSSGWGSSEAAVQPVAAALASFFCSGLQTMASSLLVDSSISLLIKSLLHFAKITPLQYLAREASLYNSLYLDL